MSEAADDRPARPAPATEVEPPQTAPSGPDATSASTDAAGPPKKKRRRGSRGGRGRRRPNGEGASTSADDEGDRQPDDLPDRPNEGRPSLEAAAKATVHPQVGDSRPAPAAVGRAAEAADDEQGDEDGNGTSAGSKRRRPPRGRRGRGRRAGGAG